MGEQKGTVVRLSMDKVNKQALGYTLLLVIISYVLHHLFFDVVTYTITITGLILFIIAMILLTVFHEAIHLLGFRYLGDVPWKELAWGVNLRMGMAYAHSKKPVKVKQLKKVLLLPFIPTGLLPFVLGIILNFTQLTFLGVILTVGCIGDFIMYKELKMFSDDATVIDHPTKPQFTVFE